MVHGHKLLPAGLVVLVALALGVLAGQGSLAAVAADPIYVDAYATGGNNGTSWADAYTSLQAGLAAATAGREIWVAEGTYKPTAKYGGTGERNRAFQLKNGVALYGGFDPSVGDTGFEDRDWETHVAILSGDIGTEGNPDDNSYHVFYHPSGTALDTTAILDGFTVSGGNANDDESHDYGGGMYNSHSSPALTHCTFTGNSASGGGGMYNEYSAPALTHCTFAGNSGVVGGGMYSEDSAPALTNCTFTGNSATWGGGGMFNDVSSPELTNCTFAGNLAVQGGGMFNNGLSPALTNCTFSGNSAPSGGGISNNNSSPALVNCILWGDAADEMVNEGSSSPDVSHSDIEGGCAAIDYNNCGADNIDADPRFADPDNGDYHLRSGSPCIDAGDNEAPDLPPYDFEGDKRIVDGDRDGEATVDMGVDEALLCAYLPLVARQS